MGIFEHRRASRLPLATQQSVHVEVFVRPVDEADIVEVKWLCTQPALKTVVVPERHPWKQQVPADVGAPAVADQHHAEAWGLGVIGAFVALFGA